MVLFYLTWLFIVAIAAYLIFKLIVYFLNKVDIEDKIGEREYRREMFNKYVNTQSKDQDVSDEEIKEKLEKFINSDF